MKYRGWIIAFVASTVASASWAGGSGLEALADAIVVGNISAYTLAWPDTIFQITVEQSLKGAIPTGSIVQAKHGYPYSRDAGSRVIREVHHGIWFLKADARGGYLVLPAYGGTTSPIHNTYFHIPASGVSAPALQASRGDSAIESVILLAAGMLEGPDGNPEEFLMAAGGTDTPTVFRILRYMASSSSGTKRATGLAGLIERKDKPALMEFLRTRTTFSQLQADRIGARLSLFDVTDVEVIRALGDVLIDPSCPAILQGEIAQALRAIHTKETLPYLAKLLDSPNPDRQQDAVFGLSGFANGFEKVTPESTRKMTWLTNRKDTPYTTDQTRHYLMLLGNASDAARQEIVTFWRNWWQDHRAELTR